VAAAQDGDEILVRPGTYTEAVVIEADIEVRGDGPVEDIVVTAPVDGPEAPTHSEFQTEPYAVLLSESSAVLSGLTFAGEPSTVIVSGGAPTVEGNVFDDVAWPFPERGTTQDGSSIVATSGSTAHIVDNELVDGGSIAVFGDASPLIEGNRLDGGPLIYLREHGVDTIVRGNEISGTAVRAIGLSGPAYAVVEDNVIRDAGTEGIRVGRSSGAAGYEPLLRNNTIEGTNTGINVTLGGAPTVEGNVLSGNDIGIYAAESSGTYADNVVEGNGRGLILSNGSPTLKGNTVQGNEVGLAALGSETTLVLTDNVICDNDVNVKLSETTPPLEYDEDNEICEDAPPE
jgi:parallel beta-helix repeat protein